MRQPSGNHQTRSERRPEPRRGNRAVRYACLAACAALLLSAGTVVAAADASKKVFVLGVDGLDPTLLQGFMDEGILPNMKRLAEQGDFKPLQTSMPPLSPIAWSTFITGMDPGGHGIYDFIHREPDTIKPYLSMSRALPPTRALNVGSWVFPLSGGSVENLRKGKAFWEFLEDGGVSSTVFRMPANFPPTEAGRGFSGMGTPDIRGTPGTFSFYTNRPVPNAANISGGKIYPVRVLDNSVKSKLHGPENSFRREAKTVYRSRGEEVEYKHPELTAEFTAYLDPAEPIAKFDVQGREFILRQGEWSAWVPVEFTMVPLFVKISAVGRFYLKQVRPDFELYVTPLQVNPADPVLPIVTPTSWSTELFRNLGYFYTQELPEDTKAFSGGIFTPAEFWTQSQFVYSERRRALDYFLDNFEEGFLFFYFSSVDQGCHMFWHFNDEKHPGYQEEEQLKGGIRHLYMELDEAVGHAMEKLGDEATLVVMSDHGFSPFYRGVNLNTWLLENGYVTLRNPADQGRYPMFVNVDWSKTQAYALGLNGLYVNLEGREANGIVKPGAAHQALLDKLERELLELTDPENGERAVTLVIQSKRDFHGPYSDSGPDIVVGYNRTYRSSWKSPLGEFPKEIFVDNKEAWSGDHAMDYRHVPGVLLTNKKITLAEPALYDLTVAILDEYGIPKGEGMLGQDCLGAAGKAVAATQPEE